MLKTLLLLLSALSLLIGAQASANDLRVTVTATGDAKAEIESFAKRELRSFKDVEVVNRDGQPLSGIFIVAAENTTVSGNTIGISVSVVTVDFLPDSSLSPELRGRIYRQGAPVVESHVIYTTTREGLQRLVRRIVAEFDTTHLEPVRQILAVRRKQQ